MKKVDCTIIPATFNEADNVLPLVNAIRGVLQQTRLHYEILFVDDSTDHTPRILRMVSKKYKEVRFLHRPKEYRTGLASAFTSGFQLAKGDIICCMDADFQHPPELIPKLVMAVKKTPATVAVASRHVLGGSIVGLESWYRKIASGASKFVAHLLLPRTRKTKDPMSGFFAFKRSLLRKKTLRPTGFKILVELLVRITDAVVVDIPLKMQKRLAGTTKASVSQGIEFFKHVWNLAQSSPQAAAPAFRWSIAAYRRVRNFLTIRTISRALIAALAIIALVSLYELGKTVFAGILLSLAFLQMAQGIFGMYLMVYAWEDPQRAAKNNIPKTFEKPRHTFTAIIPARHEATVIAETIASIARIAYPRDMMEAIVVIREDDPETITAAKRAIAALPKDCNVTIHRIMGLPINKPHHLNAALSIATGEIVCVFDAEDETHPDIYNVVNTVYMRNDVDIVQGGVQLINHHTSWYSMFNVIEYFLWFCSSLHYFAERNMIPLGGNTVFFKKIWLQKVGGWDMEALTEDADIGIRLSLAGARTKVIYDATYATREETPPTLRSFIKQRTRWIQGFMQILQKPQWKQNQTFAKKFFTFYVLGWPAIQAVLLFSIPFSVAAGLILRVHPIVSLIANIPLLVLALFLIIQSIALYEFTRQYKRSWSPWYIIKIVIFYMPYQIILGISAIRAIVRQFKNQIGWEKTEHINAHRAEPLSSIEPLPVVVLEQKS